MKVITLFPANQDTLINLNHITSLSLVQTPGGERLHFTIEGIEEPVISRPFGHFSSAYRWLTRFLQGYLTEEAVQEVLNAHN